MRSFLLAAGEGTRLWPITGIIPKCLLPVGGKPCIRIIADRISECADLKGQLTVCCLQKDLPLFVHEFRDLKGVMFSATVQPEGTVGQVLRAMSEYPMLDDEDSILLHYGDSLADIDYGRLLAIHTEKENDVTLVVDSTTRSPYGRVVVTPGTPTVTGFEEKPVLDGNTWTGIAMLKIGTARKGMFQWLDFGKDIFPRMVAAGNKIEAVSAASYHDIGTVPMYKEVNDLAMQGLLFGGKNTR